MQATAPLGAKVIIQEAWAVQEASSKLSWHEFQDHLKSLGHSILEAVEARRACRIAVNNRGLAACQHCLSYGTEEKVAAHEPNCPKRNPAGA